MKNILIGGKLGDFVHSLIIPKYLFDVTGERFNVYICNHEMEIFASGLEKSYQELLPIIQEQEYINDFGIFSGNEFIDIDLTMFRNKENLLSTSWNEFYLWNYIDPSINVPFNFSWLKLKNNNVFNDTLLINRNNLPFVNEDAETVYKNYIRGYSGRVYFVCSWESQYENFPFKNEVPMLFLPNLYDMARAISSCKHFLGNLTATSAFASAVNKPRTIEIFSDPIRTKYLHEIRNYNNLICFQ